MRSTRSEPGSVASGGARETARRSTGRMLRLRVLTALIAAPSVIAAIFLLPSLPFAIVFLALTGIGVLEWANLAGLRSVAVKAAYVAGFAVLGWFLLQLPQLWPNVFTGIVGFWVLAALIVLTYPASSRVLVKPVLVPAGYVVFVGAWLALVALVGRDGGAWIVLWIFVVVWSADIGAYFCGRRFGRRKLAVHVSPGKSWEGAVGGVLLATVLGAVLGLQLPALAVLQLSTLYWVCGALLVAIVSVFGDLFESALKRSSGVKDSGSLFPGHGGMLDRIDSLVAALPCVALAAGQLGSNS